VVAWRPRAGGMPVSIRKRLPSSCSWRRPTTATCRRRSGPAPAGTRPAIQRRSYSSREDFNVNWDRQVGCSDQYERATSDSVWTEMLASDPVGATWGPGVRRARKRRCGAGRRRWRGRRDSDAVFQACTTSRSHRSGCRNCSPTRRAAKGVHRPGVLVAQRDVGKIICCCSARRSNG